MTMALIGKYTVMLVVAFLFSLFAHWAESDYLTGFFAQNAILLAVTIFTIHAAAVGILLSQIEILRRNTTGHFSNTMKGIQWSFYEAFLWLSCTMLSAIAISHTENSPIACWPYFTIWGTTLLLFSVIALLAIIHDTINAILACLGILKHQET